MKIAKRVLILGIIFFVLGIEVRGVIWALSEYVGIDLPLTERQVLITTALTELVGAILFTFGLVSLYFHRRRKAT
jgi:hypothetical protein